MQPPPLRLPDPVRADLDAHRSGLANEFEQQLTGLVRPRVAITSSRVAPHPLRRSPLGRLFKRPTSGPSLGVLDSKFGGVPYCETEEDWSDRGFLGQIDLARATAVLPPEYPRLTGLLRLDHDGRTGLLEPIRVTWFSRPSADRAVAARPANIPRWETRLEFRLAWSLPQGDALDELWPLSEPQWYDYERFFPEGYDDVDGDVHMLLGHKPSGLYDPYQLENAGSYECLLRVPFDNTAGFHWGSNCVYIVVPRDDLARGDLSHAIATAANA